MCAAGKRRNRRARHILGFDPNRTGESLSAPPDDWQKGVIRLAEKRLVHYRKVIDELR